MAAPLKTVVFLGSARSQAPFWGGLPPRTGDRVLKFVRAGLDQLNSEAGDKVPALEVFHVVDILNMPSMLKMDVLSGNPSYYAAKDPTTLPDDIAGLVRYVEEADCFLIVSPEYNHTIPPVLTHLMNMVGCSKYANKASGTVCYSGFSTPAGGARCAVALRPFLSELGCLPVSKQVILPDANKLLTEDGVPQGDHAGGMQKQLTAMLEQLRWWAEAARTQRAK